jgi:hypothetical protein
LQAFVDRGKTASGDVMMKTNRLGWIAASVGGLVALAASMMRTCYDIWPAILLIAVVAGATAAIGEWRIYRRYEKRGHLWGAVGSLLLTLLLTSYLIGSR